jgi:hypothetical protein
MTLLPYWRYLQRTRNESPLHVSAIDVQKRTAVRSTYFTHNYDSRSESPPMTKTEGDIERKSPQELHIHTRYVI